jgi:hypothetical protein
LITDNIKHETPPSPPNKKPNSTPPHSSLPSLFLNFIMGQAINDPVYPEWVEDIPEVEPTKADDESFKQVNDAASFVDALTARSKTAGHGSDGIGLAYSDCM